MPETTMEIGEGRELAVPAHPALTVYLSNAANCKLTTANFF